MMADEVIAQVTNKKIVRLPDKIIEKLGLENGGFLHFIMTDKNITIKKAEFKKFGE